MAAEKDVTRTSAGLLKPGSIRRIFVITGVAALVIIYLLLWVRMIVDPSERTGTDFIAFYSAGRIMLSGDRADVYSPPAQVAQEELVLGFPILPQDLNPFVHPPFILPILAVVALLPYVGAFHLWAVFLLCLYAAAALVFLRTIAPAGEKRIFLAGTIFFFPAFVSILNGQDSAVLLLGAGLWCFGLLNEKDPVAGLGLALTTIRPHLALILALPFLFKRQRVWWWFLAGSAGLAIFSFLLVGVKGTENFLSILQISASGEGYKINETAMVNLLGLLRRGFPAVPPPVFRSAGWIVYVCALVFLCVVWARSRKIEEKHLGTAVLLAVFTAPHLHYHDLVLLLIPVICVISMVRRQGISVPVSPALWPLVISWLLLVSNSLPILKFTLPCLLEAWLLLALWYPGRFIWAQRRVLEAP